MRVQEPSRHQVTLSGVSETALLTLNARANEARRRDAVIDDPMAIELVDSIDFDFAKFGRTSQDIALRARAFDAQVQAYLGEHPSATVVALAEGLQTSFWRVDAALPGGQFRWLTVDLPPMIDVRTRLLPSSPRASVCAQSALDYGWMDSVDASSGVCITAEGLLMYLEPEQALGLITQCAKRFPGGEMLFDLVRQVEPLGHADSLSVTQAADLVNTVPGVVAARELQLPQGRGMLYNAALSTVYRTRVFDPLRPCLTLLEFG
jgi:O-methyltransferase involved in polyketide biosynthesis